MAAHAVQISTPAPAPAQASSSNLGTTTTTTKPLPGDASAQHNPGAPSVQPLHQAPNADPSSAEIPRCNMTARYTNAEWEALVQDTERSLAADDAQREYPLPRLGAELARCIDHTLLKLDATAAQIDELCSEARREGFEAVCVRENFVARAVANLRGTDVKVACVVGFPEGTQDLAEKSKQAIHALQAGASELDIVLNYPALLLSPPPYEALYLELAALRSIAPPPTTLKLILETSQLPRRAIVAAAALASAARFDFLKTSTGFRGHGATAEHVALLRRCAAALGPRPPGRPPRPGVAEMRVKASGGVRGLGEALRMVAAGAHRIGTSSGVWIMQEARELTGRRERGIGVAGDDEEEDAGSVVGRPVAGMTRLYTDDVC